MASYIDLLMIPFCLVWDHDSNSAQASKAADAQEDGRTPLLLLEWDSPAHDL
jgi:hypothetical protein